MSRSRNTEWRGWCLDTDMVITWDRHLCCSHQHHQCSQDTVPLVTSGVAETRGQETGAGTNCHSGVRRHQECWHHRGRVGLGHARWGGACDQGGGCPSDVLRWAGSGLTFVMPSGPSVRWPDPNISQHCPRPHQHTAPTKTDLCLWCNCISISSISSIVTCDLWLVTWLPGLPFPDQIMSLVSHWLLSPPSSSDWCPGVRLSSLSRHELLPPCDLGHHAMSWSVWIGVNPVWGHWTSNDIIN